MNVQPIITTERLVLRRFAMKDASDVKRLAGCRDIAINTLSIPHPYFIEDARKWISSHQKDFEDARVINLAITRRPYNYIIGSVGLSINHEHNHAEIGYWLGKPYWKQGYTTEAARALIKYGFEVLRLNRIHSHHFIRNSASGRVMQKAGMTAEGILKQHVRKWQEYQDVALYGICSEDYRKGRV